MVPAVPFALLGVVQLVAVAGWVAVAGAACFPRLIRRTTAFVVVGAALLATADVLTAVQLGDPASNTLSYLRAFGFVLLALGLADGVLQPLVVMPSVVVPLGARPVPALVAAVAGAAAATAAWARSRVRGAERVTGTLLAAGVLVQAVAAGLAAPARTSSGAAVAELGVRAAGTVLVLAGLARLANRSLLAKLVATISAGALVMAAATVGVVGPGLADRVQQQQSRALLDQGRIESRALLELTAKSLLFGQFVVECVKQPEQCVRFLSTFSRNPGWFAVFVRPGKPPQQFAQDRALALTSSAVQSLAGSSLVRKAFERGTLPTDAPAGPVVVTAPRAQLVVAAAVPGYPQRYTPDARPSLVGIYGVVIGDASLTSDETLQPSSGYAVSLVSGDGAMLASTLPPDQRGRVLDAARAFEVQGTLSEDGALVPGRGRTPTLAVYATRNPSVVLVMSRGSEEALAAQKSLLMQLFLTALLVVLIVSLLAVPLSRRIADPVRRLTVAARRVRRGDLAGDTEVRGGDEVALLGRAFNDMTASLRALTTDLRNAAEQEAGLRTRLETVLESMSDGLVVTDAAGVVTGVNPTAAELLGVDGDAAGMPLAELADVRAEDGRALLPPVHSRLEAEAVVHRADATEVPVRVGVAPLADGAGLVVVFHDMRREREVERMKTEFLSNVSHELRTPLTPIRGYAEILRRPGLPADKAVAYLDVINESSLRLARVVDLLVDVAALDAGRVEPRKRPVAVRGLVEERLAAWRERFPERADDLRRKLGARLPDVDVDAEWVAKALDELADNAVKHTPTGSPITVLAELAPEGDRVRVAVRDAGPGIAGNRLPELLGDFSQADASATRRVGGMGLGLGFVRRVAAALGLHLDVQSEPGKGSEFALLLPVAVPPPRPPRRGAGRVSTAPVDARRRVAPRRRAD